MRIVFVVAAALFLTACETGDGWVPRDASESAQSVAQPAPVVHADAAPLPPAASVETPRARDAAPAMAAPRTDAPDDSEGVARCRAVARLRAQDARANGFSLEMEQIIFDGTYKDCLNWNRLHGP